MKHLKILHINYFTFEFILLQNIRNEWKKKKKNSCGRSNFFIQNLSSQLIKKSTRTHLTHQSPSLFFNSNFPIEPINLFLRTNLRAFKWRR